MTTIRVSASRPPPPPLGPARRALLERRVRLVVAFTITYNVIEAVVAITAGRLASSSALVGFGLDSAVEVLSAAAVAWQFAGPDPQRSEGTEWMGRKYVRNPIRNAFPRSNSLPAARI